MEAPSRTTTPPFLSRQITASSRFHLNLKPAATAGLAVVCGGWEQSTPDYVIDRDTFPYFSIELVVAGTGSITLKGEDHALSQGSIFTYGPGVPHRITTSTDDPLLKYFIDFCGRQSRRLLSSCNLGVGTLLQLLDPSEVRSRFDELILLGLRQDQRTERTCALQLELLLHTIARGLQPTSAAERRLQQTFARCRQYIDRNFLTVHSVEEVASACHLHKSHLCRVFRQFHNESPLQYIQRLKMQWAADRLHRSGALVRQVADELGIDPFQFSRTFKRVHGVSPREAARRVAAR